MTPHAVFITGGTGYIGRRLIPILLERQHKVCALVRPGSEAKLPPDSIRVLGDALNKQSRAAPYQISIYNSSLKRAILASAIALILDSSLAAALRCASMIPWLGFCY